MPKNYIEEFVKENDLENVDTIVITTKNSEFKGEEIWVSIYGMSSYGLFGGNFSTLIQQLLGGSLEFKKGRIINGCDGYAPAERMGDV